MSLLPYPWQDPMPQIPPPAQAARITSFLRDHPRWSVFWDKRYGLWRAAEDDPGSDLHAEAGNADTTIQYITALRYQPSPASPV